MPIKVIYAALSQTLQKTDTQQTQTQINTSTFLTLSCLMLCFFFLFVVVNHIHHRHDEMGEPRFSFWFYTTAPCKHLHFGLDIENSISLIFDFGKFNSVVDPSIPSDAQYNCSCVVTVTGIGNLGPCGNQILKYMFLSSFPTHYGTAELQVPGWVGPCLFRVSD